MNQTKKMNNRSWNHYHQDNYGIYVFGCTTIESLSLLIDIIVWNCIMIPFFVRSFIRFVNERFEGARTRINYNRSLLLSSLQSKSIRCTTNNNRKLQWNLKLEWIVIISVWKQYKACNFLKEKMGKWIHCHQ